MSRNKKFKKEKQLNIDTSCSAIIAKKIPQKFKDPGTFIIPIEIRDIYFTDKSLLRPKCVLENVLIKVRNFINPADFVVLDFKEDQKILILLGRSLLGTFRSTIDLEKNELTIKIDGEIEVFKCSHDF
ncbi:signal transducer and activator of transcription A-like [Gossypium australe]|uniref:Signal transducer and activator of transcription A-like n=1 Tax=Gossypium australe TaxID=47621 RepID=A0A5B6VPU1_9ROSI|nr:signal transducer and activator of transcription A-like [Gossypium australe]